MEKLLVTGRLSFNNLGSIRRRHNVRKPAAWYKSRTELVHNRHHGDRPLGAKVSDGRSDRESRIKAMKTMLARFGPEDERLRSREAALDSDLQASQAKLNELNGQLDALMNKMRAP